MAQKRLRKIIRVIDPVESREQNDRDWRNKLEPDKRLAEADRIEVGRSAAPILVSVAQADMVLILLMFIATGLVIVGGGLIAAFTTEGRSLDVILIPVYMTLAGAAALLLGWTALAKKLTVGRR